MGKTKAPLTAAAAKLEKYRLWPSLRFYDQLGVPYVLGDMKWNGPLWTGHCMMLDTKDTYKDPGFFHELAHWLAATPTQRKLPDFGIDRQVNSSFASFATSSTPYVFELERDRARRGWGGACRTAQVSQGQESIACWALGIYEPLCGLLSWDCDPLPPLNEALYDFAGQDGVFFTRDYIKRVYKTVVSVLDESVTLDMVAGYLKRVEIDANS